MASNEPESYKPDPEIKHLVISGGGPAGLLTYGAIQHLAKQDVWHLKNIKSIYGCSVGAYLAVVVSLGYDWDSLDDYFIKRPWNKMVNVSSILFFEAFTEKGLLGEKLISNAILPLLSAKELSESITLSELYAYNHIDIHLFATNLNTREISKVDISHTTHPTLSVIKAIMMSMAYPFAIKPVFIGEDCFIDGGLLNNYPLNDCLASNKCEKDEILAFKNNWVIKDLKITQESSIIDMLLLLMLKMQQAIDTGPLQCDVKNTVCCLIENLDGFPEWLSAMATEDMRLKLIEKGIEQAKLFLQNIMQK